MGDKILIASSELDRLDRRKHCLTNSVWQPHIRSIDLNVGVRNGILLKKSSPPLVVLFCEGISPTKANGKD